ncbi:1,2-dihydroxy-3-keto-5-methylthiopentene dioxygenase [Thelotrema lepadinum]|nr:1,2-dihydroxy-3-keto-5-methylthiopentene dioxygenase [Thelotrema lepadinum]
MKAYYYDDVEGDPRLPHLSPSPPLTPSHLTSLGVLSYHFPSSSPSSPFDVNSLAASRSYSHRDTITVSPQAMGAVYEDKIKSFFHEHMHEDEEIRYILDGAGYFDVRERGDERWVRIRLEEGDLIVLPAGVYHRFTVDENNYIKAMRLFKDEPKWTPLNRGKETEENEFRKQYVEAREGRRFGDAVTV